MTSKHSTLNDAFDEADQPADQPADQRNVPRDFPRAARLIVTAEDAGRRLDRFLTAHLPDFSRTRIQSLLDHGHARVNGAPAKRSHRVEAGDAVAIEIPPPTPMHAQPEAIPLEILYSDEDLIVVNKPAGMVVHPGAGVKTGTMVNALLHAFGSCGELSSIGGELRPGIVHRLDRETSGALLVARNDKVHRALSDQFRDRRIGKTYIALLHGRLKEDTGRIELPISRDLHRRVRMTARRREGRAARTDWRVRMRLPGYTFLEADLHSGRTHQIRVHFSALGHPVVGDTLYGAPAQPKAGATLLPPLGRNFLHAARLRFLHPTTGKAIDVRAPMPLVLSKYLVELARASGVGTESIDAVLAPYL
ncbi:MAG TPA: RluA family pseudouridine synthase [Candidatus Acidoferrales bacterium]|nr:RluA family pseudouridine synthase [Candidatus Acidoferrales bacterium]